MRDTRDFSERADSSRVCDSVPSHNFTQLLLLPSMSDTSNRAMASNNSTTTMHRSQHSQNYHYREGGGGEEAIVDKLHGVMAALRRERDDLHRKKALAEERLALFQEEKDALEKTHANARIKLEAIKTSGNEDAIREVTELEQEVIRLNKEVCSFDGKFYIPSDFSFLLNAPNSQCIHMMLSNVVHRFSSSTRSSSRSATRSRICAKCTKKSSRNEQQYSRASMTRNAIAD